MAYDDPFNLGPLTMDQPPQLMGAGPQTLAGAAPLPYSPPQQPAQQRPQQGPSIDEYIKTRIRSIPYRRIEANGDKTYDTQLLHDTVVGAGKEWMEQYAPKKPEPADAYKAAMGRYYDAQARQLDAPDVAEPMSKLDRLKVEEQQIKNDRARHELDQLKKGPTPEPVETPEVPDEMALRKQVEARHQQIFENLNSNPKYKSSPEALAEDYQANWATSGAMATAEYGPLFHQLQQSRMPAPAPAPAPVTAAPPPPPPAPVAAPTTQAPKVESPMERLRRLRGEK